MAIGLGAMSIGVSPNDCVAIGVNTLHATSGQYNVGIGENAGYATTSGGKNTYIGTGAGGLATTAASNVVIGFNAGYNETASNTFYIGNIQQSSQANDRAYSLLYGTFSGSAASLTGQQLTINGTLNVNGNLALTTAGNKISIATGSNASAGTAVLVAGTVTVSTTAITASSIVILTCQVLGTVTVASALTKGTVVAGTSFVINSAVITDTSTIGWLIIN
jgi:hypothetical protein